MNTSRSPLITEFLFLALILSAVVPSPPARADTPPPLPLVHDGEPACEIALLTDADPDWLLQHAADAITGTIRRWSNADLPVKHLKQSSDPLPEGPAIILATTDALRRLLPDIISTDDLFTRVLFLDEQGFICTRVAAPDATHVFVVARTTRGVYNGAVYLSENRIDGTREDLSLSCGPVVRTPRLLGRAAYTLTIWGHEAEYSPADWENIFDSFARDGFDRVYFWVSGHFPSKKFPQTHRCRNGNWDTTERSNIGTLDDLQRIIRAAHDRGLKLYAGGALGGWCCTWLLTNGEPGTTKTPLPNAPYPGKFSLCPSHPKSRRALIDYYNEIFDALPEVDGLFIESADEWGACACPLCSETIDALGSTRFGQSQLSLIQNIMRAVWSNHPHARLAYTIGYDEHRKDPAYYRLVSEMTDPRIEWMEARDQWAFPGPDGENRPAASFSPRVMRWRQYYGSPLEHLVHDTRRIADAGFYGCITAFEPGAGTGSFHTQIPHPTDEMPYVLTGFVFRETTWDPAPTVDAMRERVQRRFFGREAPDHLSADLWDLRELIREASSSRKQDPKRARRLADIEAHVNHARPSAGPKTLESLDLMTRAIADLRAHLEAAP